MSAAGIEFVRGHLQKAVFYSGGIEEAQGFYKCFMLSRLRFSTGSKKKNKRGSKTRGSGAAALLAGCRARSAPSRPPAPTSPFLSRADFTLLLSVSQLLSLATGTSAASLLIAPPYTTQVFS